MMKRPNKDDPGTAGEIRGDLVNIANQLANLDRTVGLLANRLHVRVEDDEFPSLKNWGEIQTEIRLDAVPILGSADLTKIRDTVRAIKWGLDAVFRDIGVIRAHMDAVANDAMLRDEFKGYLAPRKKD